MRRPSAQWAGWVAATLIAIGGLTACGRPPVDQPSPTVTSEPAEQAQTPRPVPEDHRFELEESAQFDDGLLLEIAGAEASKAKETDLGAEGTNGEIVIASVRLENHTGKSFDPREMLVVATYGDDVPAPLITDETGELTTGFGDVVADGDEGVATLGFAIPASGLGEVTIVVDPNDDLHEPVSFTGAVRGG